MPARPVVVVGDVGLDVLVRPHCAVIAGGDTPSNVAIVPGGSGGNTAAWLAATGTPVALVARVGADDAARSARDALEAAGVVCRFTTDPVLPTCVVVVVVDASGERTMLPDRGANAALSAADLDLAGAATAAVASGSSAAPATELPDAAEQVTDLPDAREQATEVPNVSEQAAEVPYVSEQAAVRARAHLHLSGFVLLDERSRDAGLAALRRARMLGWTTSVDPQAANHVDRVGADTFLDWVRGVDLLLPNEAEARALGGDGPMLAAAHEVAVSLGGRGARWLSAAGDWHTDAPVVRRPETTGCGDAFDAGVLASWLAGGSPAEALASGVRAGSAVAAGQGARSGVGHTRSAISVQNASRGT